MSPIAAKTYTTEVICLRTYDFGEADKILNLYSPEHGRISAIAKGVKKPKSKLAGACELLNLSEVQLSRGRNLDLLCQYQPRETFVMVRSDLLKLTYGLLFVELVNLTAGEADSQAVFHDLKWGLERLNTANEAETLPIGIDFQLALLQAEGYQPVLNRCIFSEIPLNLDDSDALYFCFSAQLGGITSPSRKKQHMMASTEENGGFNEQWVNVSATTLRLLTDPYNLEWQIPQFYKAQKFLHYYFRQIFEKNLHAFDMVFNLLEMPLTEPFPRSKSVTPCEVNSLD